MQLACKRAGAAGASGRASSRPSASPQELERLFDSPGLLAGAAAKAKAMAETEAVSKLADLAEELARADGAPAKE